MWPSWIVALKQAKYFLLLMERKDTFTGYWASFKGTACLGQFISDVVNDVDLFKQSCSCTCVPLLPFPSQSLVRIAYFISIYFVSLHLFWHLQTVTTFICPEPFAVPLNSFNSGSVWMLFLYWFTVIWRNTEFCHVIQKSEFLLNSIINI